jgi:hypothetical protein
MRWKIHDTYTGGVPDAWYAGPAGTLFVEYKYVLLPQKSTTPIKVGLSAQQRLFLNRLIEYHLSCVIIVAHQNGAAIFSPAEVDVGLFKESFSNPLSVPDVADWITNSVTNSH